MQALEASSLAVRDTTHPSLEPEALIAQTDRLALALWWLIESVADEFQMPPAQAADEVAMLCGLVKEMKRDSAH